MESLSKLRKKIKKVIPLKYRKNTGALNPYMIPIYAQLVYYKRLKFCLKAIKKHTRFPKEAAFKFTDIGCGFGVFMRIMGKEYPNAKLYGIDKREKEQLQHGAKLVNNKNAELIQGDALNLPYENNSFDIVLTTDVLEHVNDPIKGLNEIKRIIKPHGLVVILVPTELFLFKALRRLFGKRKFHADYHWVGTLKSVNEFEKELKRKFRIIERKYVPIPFLKSILNYDLMYVCK